MAEVELVKDFVESEAPQPQEVEAEDTKVTFVPFEDFEGSVNREQYSYRKDIPVKVEKWLVNIWLDAKKGYIK